MSLINDALRRAKQAQQDAPPPTQPDPHFRPVDSSTQAGRHGIGLLLPALLAAVALLSLLLVWELSHGTAASSAALHNRPLMVAARSASNSDVSGTIVELPSVEPEVAATPAPAADSTASAPVSGSNATAAVAGSGDTNHAAGTEAPVQAPAPLKLQSIVYNPKRPSAMINGRVVFLGDRLREYRVMGIRRDEVILVGAGQTNVLSLEP